MIIEIKEKNRTPLNVDHFSVVNTYINDIKHFTINEAIKFININKNNSDTIVIRNSYTICINNKGVQTSSHFFYDIVEYIYNNISNIKLKFIIFTNDWWIRSPIKHNKIIKYIFKCPSNIKVLTHSNIDIISNFHNINYTQYKSNILNLLSHSVLPKDIQKYNNNPDNKIIVFGDYTRLTYPYRVKIAHNNKYVEKCDKLPYAKFKKKINDTFACFTSSVHPNNYSNNKWESCNAILKKVFEILAGGSLLLYPKDEEKYLNKIGLVNNKNCILIDMSNDIVNQCKYIIDPNNRKEIEKIRFAGYNHAISKLTQKEILKPLISFFNEIK